MERVVVIGVVFMLFMPVVSLDGTMNHAIFLSGNRYNDGRTLYVGGSGPNNYTSIQDAIDDAKDGDTVFVYNGTYYENVVINKSINLIGEDKNTTIIDGGGNKIGIYISGKWVNVSGFKVINCRADFHYEGAGIFLTYSFYSCISNNIIVDNTVDGIRLSHSYYNIISDNEIINNGGEGINIYLSKRNNLTNNYIENNYRGIFMDHGDYNYIFNNVIKNGLFKLRIGDIHELTLIPLQTYKLHITVSDQVTFTCTTASAKCEEFEIEFMP